MTAVQLTLDDCDPTWQPTVEPRPRRRQRKPEPARHDRDLAAGLTWRQPHRMTTIRPDARYL